MDSSGGNGGLTAPGSTATAQRDEPAAASTDIVLLGPVGSGKGTQARWITERFTIPHVASGDLLRQHRREGTELGKQAQEYMDRGDLVPDDLVINMILERMHQPDAAHGVLLDGFPRTVTQADALDEELRRANRHVKVAIYLKVPEALLIKRAANRWTCRSCQATYHTYFNPPKVEGVCDRCGGELYQREDDRHEVVTSRIRVYLKNTAPVVEYYRARGILSEIDGAQDIDVVHRAIDFALGN